MLTIPAPDAVKTIRTEHLEIKQEAKSFGTYVGKRSRETGDEAGTYLTCDTFKRGTFSRGLCMSFQHDFIFPEGNRKQFVSITGKLPGESLTSENYRYRK